MHVLLLFTLLAYALGGWTLIFTVMFAFTTAAILTTPKEK